MFREMRRVKNAISENEAKKLLEEGSCGVLSVNGDEGYPYGIPVNYAVSGEYIYIHGARKGYKTDVLQKNSKVCFTLITRNVILPEETSTDYESVIVFGQADILSREEEAERKKALELITYKFCPKTDEIIKKVERSVNNVDIIRVKIEHITGKRYISLETMRNMPMQSK